MCSLPVDANITFTSSIFQCLHCGGLLKCRLRMMKPFAIYIYISIYIYRVLISASLNIFHTLSMNIGLLFKERPSHIKFKLLSNTDILCFVQFSKNSIPHNINLFLLWINHLWSIYLYGVSPKKKYQFRFITCQ